MWLWIKNPETGKQILVDGYANVHALERGIRSLVTFDDGDYVLLDANLLELAHLAWQAKSAADISETLLDALGLEAYYA